MQVVAADGTRHWFDVDGLSLVPEGPAMRKRPTVVLLHGGPGGFDHSYFKPDFARLAEVAQVVYLDVYGHGRSEWGVPEEWTFEASADKVREFCEAVGIESPVVLGHSLGALIALVYGIRHPEHPGALVIQNGFARFDHPRIVESFRRLAGDEIGDIVQRSFGAGGEPVSEEEWARAWAAYGPWVPLEEETARVVSHREVNPPGIARLREFDVVGELVGIACPTLVSVGELDPMAPVDAAREVADGIPGARLEVLEGGGHFPWRDVPERYWPSLTGFVESLDLAGSG
jgi:pimeloyl-ACP methyl ester carboxylesterase